jgi:hypothetical protein
MQPKRTRHSVRRADEGPQASWSDFAAEAGWIAGPLQDTWAYWTDACQRTVLFWDVMRQRGNNYLEHAEKTAPHVLTFQSKLVVDGRKLPRPVNYGLVRITPPDGTETDLKKRPFVIIDPRAGHGPGIGGFKAESEIGVAIKAGHPCYFIGFLPEPIPGQRIEDVLHAKATFLQRVIALHPEAEGKPAVIGNCQAGWATMMLAAVRPELFGPVLVAGAPLSYWAGVHGENPMRYTGGLLGGSWLTALLGDLGAGKFDGAWLVSNFENLNLANTYWTKPYNLYAKVDTEAPRYLGFEQWWGGHVLLNAEEIQFIVDQLFVGNRLTSGELVTSDGVRVDLRSIRSPIVVFCSKGDNITPPAQALGWILDLYGSVDDIRAHGQTIVYAVHESIGHLGIFVSGSVARKEHDEFASNIDLIDVLPPGLYEAVITAKDSDDPSADLVSGDYLLRFEARDLNDIRALGANDTEDDRRFAAVARISEINLGLYRTFLQPLVRALVNEGTADWMRRLHPLRLQYELASDSNPFMRTIAAMAEAVRDNRQAITSSNGLFQAQEAISQQIVQTLDAVGETRDQACERIFLAAYDSPMLQALTGLKASDESPRRRPGDDADHMSAVAHRIADLKARMGDGGVREAAIRALIYVRMPEGVADERGLELLRRIRDEHGGEMTLTAFKQLVREQFLMLLLDEVRAVEAIPAMLAHDPERAMTAGRDLRRVIEVLGLKTDLGKRRFAGIERMFARIGGQPVLETERLDTPGRVERRRRSMQGGRRPKKQVA